MSLRLSSVRRFSSRARQLARARRSRRLWVLEGLEGRLLLSGNATYYTVNLTSDTGAHSGTDANTGTPSGDLLWAIEQANANTNPCGSVITFDPTVFSTLKTITLSSSLELSETDGPEVIQGPGASLLAVSGNNAVGVFQLGSGTTSAISGLTIENGSVPGYASGGGILTNGGTLTVSGCTLSDNYSGFDGGGICSSGALTVTGCTFSGNSTGLGGGAIFGGGPTTIQSSIFSGNSAPLGGGFLNFGYGSLVQNSTFTGNYASVEGGGIDDAYGSIQAIAGCTLSDNFGGGGGGIANSSNGTIALISGCSLTGNRATDGAGVYNTANSQDGSSDTNSTITLITGCNFSGNSGSSGGGIWNSATITAVNACTISGNSVSSDGGGVCNAGAMTVTGSTLSANYASNGGGIENAGTLMLTICTIAENATNLGGLGGGIENGGALTAINSTIVDNSAAYGYGAGLYEGAGSNATLYNTIVALNTQPVRPDDIDGQPGSTVSGAYNLIGVDNTGSFKNGADGNVVVGAANPELERSTPTTGRRRRSRYWRAAQRSAPAAPASPVSSCRRPTSVACRGPAASWISGPTLTRRSARRLYTWSPTAATARATRARCAMRSLRRTSTPTWPAR